MKKIEIDSFLEHKYISSVKFSPDGENAAFMLQMPDIEINGYKSAVYILNISTKQSYCVVRDDSIIGFCWLNSEKILLYCKESGTDAQCTVFKVYNAEENATVCCEYKCALNDIAAVSPIDDKRFFVIANHYCANAANLDNGQAGWDVFDELPFWRNGKGITNKKRSRLYVFDTESMQSEPLTAPIFRIENFCFDGPIAVVSGFAYTDVAPTMAAILRINADEGSCNELLAQGKRYVERLATVNGNVVAAISDDYNSYTEPYVYDELSGNFNRIIPYEATLGYNAAVLDCVLGSGNVFMGHGDKLWFQTTMNEGTTLRSLSLDGELSDAYTPLEGACCCFDIYKEHKLVCAMYGQRLCELYLDGEQVTFFNEEYYLNHTISVPERCDFTGKDGYNVHGFVMKPTDYVKGQKYPAILHIHGGPKNAFGALYHHEMQFWANHGYFVFFCNPRGSDGRGNDYAYLTELYGKVDYAHFMEFTDYVLARYEDIDPKRLGVTGGSYGGYMTNWIIGHTNRFSAAVSQRSISNWITMELTSDIGYYFDKHQQGTTVAENPEKLWWHSPLKYACNVVTPTLFIHSDNDFRCWMVECLSMFTALKMHGVESRVCLFHGETHELSRSGKPRNRIKRMQEIINWMDKYTSLKETI